MKITCERGYLTQALGVARHAVSSRSTLPILSNVLLETQDDRLKLTATDLDTAIRCVIVADVAENGEVAVPASTLADIVSKLPDAPVTLEAGDGKVSVRCGKSEYTILSLPAEDFPVVPEVREGVDLEVPQSTLKEMLRMTTFAASKEETRSILMGVLFEARGENLSLVATDTHRLAWKRTRLTSEVANPVSAIVPAKPLAELERVLRDTSEETVHIRFGASQVQFETEHVTLVSRVLDGQFPNHEKVLSMVAKAERRLKLDRALLFDAVRRVNIVARGSSEKGIFSTKGDLLEITAESQDVGRAYEEVPMSMDGSDITIAFNTRYLMEVLSIVGGDEISIELSGALTPGLLKSNRVGENGDPAQAETSEFQYVIMPMNT